MNNISHQVPIGSSWWNLLSTIKVSVVGYLSANNEAILYATELAPFGTSFTMLSTKLAFTRCRYS